MRRQLFMDMLINCGMLIDGTGREPMENCSIGIENGKIVDIIATLRSSNRKNVVDWSEFVVLPGLFDCHDHPTEDFGMEYDSEEERKVISSLRAAKNYLNILKSGITTLRDAGAKYAVNIKVRDAIKNGLIEGPDIIAAGNRISRTGYPKWPVCLEADGVDEVRKAVRQEQKGGADFIKLMATGVGAGDPVQPEYSQEEILTVIEEAHSLGLKVGVHAHGGPGATYAIQGGADIVEHGTYLTDSDFEEMVRKKISLVVTLPVLRHFKDIDELPSLSDKHVEGKFKKSYLELLGVIKKARGLGILVSLGGDKHHGDPTGNMKALRDCGISAIESITILTRDSAKICGVEKIKGTIEVGKLADIVAFEGNPIDNVKDFRKVKGVMKKGIIRWEKGH